MIDSNNRSHSLPKQNPVIVHMVLGFFLCVAEELVVVEHLTVPTSKRPWWGFRAELQCHGVYYGIQRVQVWTHLTGKYPPSTSQASPDVV